MKTIKLTQGLVAIVDDEDYKWLNQHKWYANKKSNTFYAVRCYRSDGKQKTILMHREIIQNNSKLPTDHKNGNGLDNRKSNLRIVTNRQNQQNKHIVKTSIYPGVCWRKQNKKWKAYIRINGILKCLGFFTNELVAHQAYIKALQDIDEIFINDLE